MKAKGRYVHIIVTQERIKAYTSEEKAHSVLRRLARRIGINTSHENSKCCSWRVHRDAECPLELFSGLARLGIECHSVRLK